MAPPYKSKVANPNAWWEDAYGGIHNITVQWELKFEDDLIRPGNLIKIKNQRGNFKFRCVAHNIVMDITWIDCLDSGGAYRSFPIHNLKGIIKPKKSRRRKPNVNSN